jgi:hypothetical protein
MGKKWYSYFVTVDPATGEDAPAPSGDAAQTIAEIAKSVAPPAPPPTLAPVADPQSFEQIYDAAGIAAPVHGFTIFKIADMLKSEHIRALPVEIKRSSVLLALDAAGVKLQEIVEDAVKRDRALDTFELVQQRALDRLESEKAEDNKKLQAEADRVLNELRARIQANNDAVARERERIQTWRLRKQQEEKRIAEAVAPFASENPITTGPAVAPAKPEPSAGR